MVDVGAEYGHESTWRRPHLPQAGSRLDYILVSGDFKIHKFVNKWLRFDHSMLNTEIFLTEIFRGKAILKDWSLASPLFLDQAPDIVRDILLNHDVNFRNISMEDRLQFVNERKVSQYELELSVFKSAEGATHAHILEIIIQKLSNLQRKVQNRLKNKRKRHSEGLSANLGSLYKRSEQILPHSPEYANIQERILDRQKRGGHKKVSK